MLAGRLRAALAYLPASQLVAAPVYEYLTRDTAFGKLAPKAEGAAIGRWNIG